MRSIASHHVCNTLRYHARKRHVAMYHVIVALHPLRHLLKGEGWCVQLLASVLCNWLYCRTTMRGLIVDRHTAACAVDRTHCTMLMLMPYQPHLAPGDVLFIVTKIEHSTTNAWRVHAKVTFLHSFSTAGLSSASFDGQWLNSNNPLTQQLDAAPNTMVACSFHCFSIDPPPTICLAHRRGRVPQAMCIYSCMFCCHASSIRRMR